MDEVRADFVEVAVIGGGPGGLSAASVLKRKGFHPVVLEREAVGAFWRKQYDRIHLHTIRWLSNLPGYHFNKSYGKWVSRDGVVNYLERYARHYDLDIRIGVDVQRLERTESGWRLETSKGPIDAWAVVVATGYNLEPIYPQWPGIDTFQGEVLLGANYLNPVPYRGRNVLVVGCGNTGAEIAADLKEGSAGNVWLSYRTPPNIGLRDGPIPPPLLGMVLRALRVPVPLGDKIIKRLSRGLIAELETYGIPPAPRGQMTSMVVDDQIPVIDVGLIAQLRKGAVKMVPGVQRVSDTKVELADGTSVEPDVVIACVGYRRGLEPLIGHLGVLGPKGKPMVFGGDTLPNAPRLFFVGYKNTIAGMFREFGYEAKHLTRVLRKEKRTLSSMAASSANGSSRVDGNSQRGNSRAQQSERDGSYGV
jgi:cation diffusion facilitator CzcD-associated flavoprotein CzcO